MSRFKLSVTLKEWGAFFIIAFLGFGVSFYCIKIALKELNPLEITVYRLTFAMISLWILAIVMKIPIPCNFRIGLKIGLCGVIGSCIPFVLIGWAEKSISSGIAGVLNSLTPIFTIILSGIFISRKEFTPRLILCVLLGFIGVLFIFSDKLMVMEVKNTQVLLPELAMMAAAFCYALQTIYIKSYLKKENFIMIAVLSTTISAIIMWIILLTTQHTITIPKQGEVITSVIWMAIMSTCFSQVLLYYLIKQWSPTRVSFIAYLIPIVALTLGFIALDEHIGLNAIFGICAIIFSIVLANSRKKTIDK